MFPERIKVPVMKDVNLLSDVRNFVYVQSNADKERIMEIIAVRIGSCAWSFKLVGTGLIFFKNFFCVRFAG